MRVSNAENYIDVSRKGRKLIYKMTVAEKEAMRSERTKIMLQELMLVCDSGNDGFVFGVIDTKTNEEIHYHVKIAKEIVEKGK